MLQAQALAEHISNVRRAIATCSDENVLSELQDQEENALARLSNIAAAGDTGLAQIKARVLAAASFFVEHRFGEGTPAEFALLMSVVAGVAAL